MQGNAAGNRSVDWVNVASLSVVIAAGAAVAVHRAHDQSLRLDELFSWRVATSGWHDAVTKILHDVHPPLYFGLLRAWTAVAGDSEWALRLPSLAAWAAGVVAAWRLVFPVSGRGTALLASGLLSAGMGLLFAAQDARPYALLVALTLWTQVAYVHGFAAPATSGTQHTGGTRRARVAWGVLAAATLWTHVIGLFVVFGHVLHQGATWRATPPLTRRRFVATTAVVGAVYIPWLFVLWRQASARVGGFWIPRPTLPSIAGDLAGGAGPTWLVGFLIVGAVTGSPLLARLVRRDLSDPERRVTGVLWCMLASLVLVAGLLSQGPIALLYANPLLPAAAIVAVLGAIEAQRWLGHRAPTITVAAMLLVAGFVAAPPPKEFEREPWADALAYAEARAEPGAALVFFPGFNHDAGRYYGSRADLDYSGWPARAITDADQFPERLHGSYSEVWLLAAYYDRTPGSADVAALAALADQYGPRVASHVFDEGGVVIDVEQYER